MIRHLRRLAAPAAALVALLTLGPAARADLLRPALDLVYPQVSTSDDGSITYTPDATPGTGGVFEMTNQMHRFVMGPTHDQQYVLSADDNGVLEQNLTVLLGPQGQLLPTPAGRDDYTLTGQVTINGQTFNGLLLSGYATGFGSLDLDSLGARGQSIFDAQLQITGGALAGLIGPEAYLRLRAADNSTFTGSFSTPFGGSPVVGLLVPTPEPATWLLLGTGIAGVVLRQRLARRRA